MRVLTFLHSFEPGGVERIALRLVRYWRAHDVDAPLFLGRPGGIMADDVGRDLEFRSPRQPPFGTQAWETLWMILTLPRAVRSIRPDVIFCAGNTYTVIALALKLLLGRSCPPILAKISNSLDPPQQSWPRRFAYRIWLRLQGRFINHFVGMEKPMAAEIGDAMRVSSDDVTIIPDPALSRGLIEKLRSAPQTPRPPTPGRRFVAVGRLAPQKNVALMLRAFMRGARSDDRLTVFGDGPERPKLEILAKRLGINDRVEFRGYVADPATLLHGFDILLLSSDYEGVPAVVLEALAANLSIIATDCSRSMATLLQGGALGELVDVGNELMLASAIARARVGNQDCRATLRQAKRFTLEHAAEAYLSVLRQISSRPAPREILSLDGCGSPLPHRLSR
jgi:glycosyltransferase involved in cell wall biosynthesis